MRKRGSSKTAELAAMTRALATHSRYASKVMCDPYARYFLGPSTLIPYLFNRIFLLVNPFFWRVGINAVGFLIALCRHRFMNDLMLKSLDEEIRQIVLIGAGYDTSLLRITEQHKGLQLFEIDHPNTQSRKRRIIRKHSLESGSGIIYIGADLEQESIPNALYNNGLSRGEAVLVIAEGVMSYLSPHSLNRLFHSLSNLSVKVRFAADYRLPQMNEKNVSLAVKRWKKEFKMMNEQYRSFFSEQDMESKLAGHGFRAIRHHNLAQLWNEYLGDTAPRHLRAVAGIFVSEN